MHHDQHGSGVGGLEGVDDEVGGEAGGSKMSIVILPSGDGDGEAVGDGSGDGKHAARPTDDQQPCHGGKD